MTRRSRAAALVPVALLATALLTAGCSATTPPTTETPIPIVSTTPPTSPGPTMSAGPTAAPSATDTATWVVSSSGVGPVRLQSTMTEGLSAVSAAFTTSFICGRMTFLAARTGAVQLTVGAIGASDTGTVGSIGVTTATPPTAPIADSPRTAGGIALGSPRDAVLAAYPGAKTVTLPFDGAPRTQFVGGEQYFGRQYSHHGLVGSMLTR